jgi:SOS-response transcriptional repressor LexA
LIASARNPTGFIIYDQTCVVVSYARCWEPGQTFGAERFQKELYAQMAAAQRSARSSGSCCCSGRLPTRISVSLNGALPSKLLIADGLAEQHYVNCVPLVPLEAAAGAFGDPQHIEEDIGSWVAVDSRHRLRRGMFVAQVVGKSMAPTIPDCSYCLFAAPVTGSRQGKIVLVQLRDTGDPETGERYTVRLYESEKTRAGDSWRHRKITLKPINPDFKPIVLIGADEAKVQAIAELVEVL